MSDFFGALATISLIAFIVGMFKPSLVMRWAPEEKRNKKWAAIVTLACMFVFSGLAANTMTPEEKAAQQTKKEQQIQEKQAKEAKTQEPQAQSTPEQQLEELTKKSIKNYGGVLVKYKSVQISNNGSGAYAVVATCEYSTASAPLIYR